MKITTDEVLQEFVIARLKVRAFTGDREVNHNHFHVTDLIYCLRKLAWKFRPIESPLLTPTSNKKGLVPGLKMAIGTIIEQGLTLGSDSQLTKEEDGIVGTMDWVIDEDEWEYGTLPTEIKMTWKRQSATLKSEPHWFKQIITYAHLFGWLEWGLVVGHIADLGGKSPEEEIVIRGYRNEFEPEEVEENWLDMQARKQIILDFLKGTDSYLSIPITYRGYDWECSNCPLFSGCLPELARATRDKLFA